jgi:hypothetical protein
MSDDPNAVRQQAQNDFWLNPLAPLASEQTTPNAQTRETYNAEVVRQRESK